MPAADPAAEPVVDPAAQPEQQQPVTEGRVKELEMDIVDPLMSDSEFEIKYEDSRENMARDLGISQDRKTGRFYNPDQEFDRLRNSPEFGAQMRRMAQQEDVAEGSDHSLKKVWDRYSKHLMASRGDHPDVRQINKSGEITRNIRKYVKDHHGQKAVDDMERYAEKQQFAEGVAEGTGETPQQQKVRAAISNGLARSSQMGKAEYQSQPTNRTYFDNAGYASDKLTGVDSIDSDGTVVISIGDTRAADWVKKLATLGGMPGIKTREVQPKSAQGVAEGDDLAESLLAEFAQGLDGDELAEDAVDDFLARGGEIQQGKFRRPRKSEKTDYGSRHIGTLGGSGKPSKVSGTAANTRVGAKPVVAVEASGCNHTREGEMCSEHGLAECGMHESQVQESQQHDADLARLKSLAHGR